MNDSDIRITILVDNQTLPGLTAEHGFSLWIETEDRHILFDTGQGFALESNARALNVNLADTDHMILSHGHFDHTGGMPAVLKQSPQCEVYCHAGVTKPRYSIVIGVPRAIGMSKEAMAAFDKLPGKRLHWISYPFSLTDRIGITGPIPRETNFEDTGGPFFLDPEGTRMDLLDDDLALWIRTSGGLIVCLGCCHAGLVNTLSHVQNLNHGQRIRAVIGGVHLLNANFRRLENTLASLRHMKLDVIVPCHCSGETAVAAFERTFDDRVTRGAAGMVFEF